MVGTSAISFILIILLFKIPSLHIHSMSFVPIKIEMKSGYVANALLRRSLRIVCDVIPFCPAFTTHNGSANVNPYLGGSMPKLSHSFPGISGVIEPPICPCVNESPRHNKTGRRAPCRRHQCTKISGRLAGGELTDSKTMNVVAKNSAIANPTKTLYKIITRSATTVIPNENLIIPSNPRRSCNPERDPPAMMDNRVFY